MTRRAHWRPGAVFGLALGAVAAAACFDPSTRWVRVEPPPPPPPLCAVGTVRCAADVLQECIDGPSGAAWSLVEDCAAAGKVCAPEELACKHCIPGALYCEGLSSARCGPDGESFTLLETCDSARGFACRGGACKHLCGEALVEKSNVGCEYWAVDLDNAMIDAARNAAAQQYAVVVSNPQPDVPVTVRVEQDDSLVGEANAPVEIAQAIIAPLNLRVFKLGPREVDGSPEGEYDTGTHTALTRHAYRVTSDFPVVVYQFNPLENVGVFSNDASLLKPREALDFGGSVLGLAYVVASWPQTIAITDDPNTNFSAVDPTNLRAFLTIVGTRPGTRVVVHPSCPVRAGGPVPFTPEGGKLEAKLDPFDVLNLETQDEGAFNDDFTGTRIEADGPIAVFVGSEASDAPRFTTLSERRCCADHLEEQLDPVRTAGKLFALARSPSRTAAVEQAGGDLGVAPEPEYFRFVATRDGPTRITTTLDPPDAELVLHGPGDWLEVAVTRDFVATSDQPIHVIQVMASQDAANVPRLLPGGDPSLLVVPPREQYRPDYVFLTPDKYAFDFVVVVAPAGAVVRLDGALLGPQLCEIGATDGLSPDARGGPPELLTYRCQLSFPLVDPETGKVVGGTQNDGVHRVVASEPVGVMVFGFDAFVSYAYAGGTELREIAPPL
jgi:hypothetical protein